MTRKSILIESSRLSGHPDLAGARADVLNFTQYLQSDFGGAWNDDEIISLSHPTQNQLIEEIEKSAIKDYVFITFSGHGYYSKGGNIDDTIICLNDSEEIAINKIKPLNPRNLFIVDACRKVSTVSEQTIRKSFLEGMPTVDYTRRFRCRELFDKAVSETEKGQIMMYSCDLDEAAGESSSGGYFSSHLVLCGKTWSEKQPSGTASVLNTWNAFQISSKVTTERAPQQHPQLSGGRRLRYFPFAVWT